MSPSDRRAVADILALPDGPWEFSPGHATAASFFASARQADRATVAEILALPDGPWEFSPGHATAASFFASARQADRYRVDVRGRLPVVRRYDPRPARPKRKPR